jgi:hypothetical protein
MKKHGLQPEGILRNSSELELSECFKNRNSEEFRKQIKRKNFQELSLKNKT